MTYLEFVKMECDQAFTMITEVAEDLKISFADALDNSAIVDGCFAKCRAHNDFMGLTVEAEKK